jgi:ATP-dependent Lon protease
MMTSHESPVEILPLFPLAVVLFPQAQLPLHIFEDRYKTLIGECISYDTSFGINLFLDREIRPIGCSAVVTEVTKRYPDGSMDIVVEGRHRYAFHQIVDMQRPYFSGKISWYNDIEEHLNDEFREHAVRLHNEFVAVVFKGIVRSVPSTDIRKTRSFYLVQKSGMDLMQRQSFLTMRSENDRLKMLVHHFESMIPLLSSQRKIEQLAGNDGYLQE